MDNAPVPAESDPAHLAETQQALVEHWRVRGTESETLNWELLLDTLEERILDLLKNNPNKLLGTLYVLDISERTYNEAMRQDGMEARAHALAEAILRRESQKIETRRRYTPRPPEIEDGAAPGR